MSLSIGDKLPSAQFAKLADGEVTFINSEDVISGRNVVIFGLPGAFTGTCTSAHVPSFIAVTEALKANGVDEIICLATNDPWVMDAWAKSTGGEAAGITFLADPESRFTAGIDMTMDVPAIGFHARSKRYALYAEDGIVKIYNPEELRGVCDISGGQTMLAQITA